MKRILAILCSVILVVTCCVMVGCDDKETYEMSLMVHCASNTETSYYIENNVYAVFTPYIDTVVLDLYRIEKRYYILEYACIAGWTTQKTTRIWDFGILCAIFTM